MEEEVKTIEIEVQVKTAKAKVGTKPLVVVQVEIIVKETHV